MNEQIREVARQRESALREVAELKTQLKMVEETRDAIRRDLIEANRTIREGRFLDLIKINKLKLMHISMHTHILCMHSLIHFCNHKNTHLKCFI